MRVWILITGAVLAACSGGTEPGQGDRLLVASTADTLRVDSTAQLHAFLLDGNGDSADVPGAVWSSRNPDIASVTEDGIVTGHASGVVTLVALAGDLRGTAEIRVERRFLAKDVSTGSAGICAVDLDGEIWCQNGWGTGVPYPEADTSDIRTFVTPVSGSEHYAQVGSNRFFACGLSTSKHVLCWGSGILWDSLSAAVPTPIVSSITFDTLSVDGWMGCGLSASTAWCWGGQMRRVSMITNGGTDQPLIFSRIAVQNYDGCGWAPNGHASCWDSDGLSTYSAPIEPSPPATPVLHGIANGGTFFCGLDADNHAWCWGENESGQLGNGTLAASSAAVQVSSDRRFQRVTASIDENSRRVCAIAETDELFCWGGGISPIPAAILY